MSSDIAGHDDRVAGFGQRAGRPDSLRNDPDAGGVDEYAVHLSLSGHFSISRDDLHADFRRCLLHGVCDLFEGL